jgi:hypothetical protein
MGANSRCHLVAFLLVGATAISIGAVAPAAAQSVPKPPRPQWCLPSAMVQNVYNGDLDRALAHSEECVASHMRWASGAPVPNESVADTWERSFAAPYVVLFLCSNAQLQAMAGSISQAEATLERAERWGSTLGELFDPYPHEILVATRGFIYERAGRLEESAVAYRSGGKIGASRLAILALTAKDDSSAALWARLAGDTPSALAVAGALAELRGDDATAFLMYYNSDLEMRRMFEEHPTLAQLPPESGSLNPREPGPNPSLTDYEPIQFAERTRVVKALARFGTRKPPPPPVQNSAIVRDGQAAFNKWLQEQRALKVPGIAYRPQYPGFFMGFGREARETIRQQKIAVPPGYDASVVLYLPETLAVTGLVDRDTLALDFYRLAAAVLSLAARGGVTPAQLLSAEQPAGASPERLVLLTELRSVLANLENLHRVVQDVPLRTTAGAVHTALDQARLYAQWTPDFSTAHLDVVTPELAKSIEAATAQVRARLESAQRFVR